MTNHTLRERERETETRICACVVAVCIYVWLAAMLLLLLLLRFVWWFNSLQHDETKFGKRTRTVHFSANRLIAHRLRSSLLSSCSVWCVSACLCLSVCRFNLTPGFNYAMYNIHERIHFVCLYVHMYIEMCVWAMMLADVGNVVLGVPERFRIALGHSCVWVYLLLQLLLGAHTSASFIACCFMLRLMATATGNDKFGIIQKKSHYEMQ